MNEKEMRARIKQLEKALYKIDVLVGKIAKRDDYPARVSRVLNKMWDTIDDAGAGLPYGKGSL